MPRRKLIEVALPLDSINEQSAHEKKIKSGQPSSLHLWWSRKPTATARAVLFAQMVDDPSNFLDQYRAEARAASVEDVEAFVENRVERERERLFAMIERLVMPEELQDHEFFRKVREEVLRATGGRPVSVLDPFSGGGSIPLEAQRLGLLVTGSDLNPPDDAPLMKTLLVILLSKYIEGAHLGSHQKLEVEAWEQLMTAALRDEISQQAERMESE
jgi:putative DNA methylase